MSDILNENGLKVKNATELRNDLINGFKKIYGDDINLDSNTQDGQLIELLVQMNVTMREMLTELYNTGDPDLCRGRLQDVRYRINNIFRKKGKFTIIPMSITCNSTVTLQGLDSGADDINSTGYGVSDDSGNVFYLLSSQTFEAGTTKDVLFRSAVQSDINPPIGTVINPLEIKIGITSVSNEKTAISVGDFEEYDDDFEKRRAKSVSINGQNSTDSITSQLLNLANVNDVFVYNHDFENYPTSNDADGIPPHYIWVIVDGGTDEEVANTIYMNIAGAGTKGSQNVELQTVSGQSFTVNFDRVESKNLYLKFDLREVESGTVFNLEEIKENISKNLKFSVNEYAETSKITEVIREAIALSGNLGLGLNVQISDDNVAWTSYISCPSKLNKFVILPENITIEEINI